MKWLCILASLIWGSNIVLMKSLLKDTAPMVIASWRVLFSAVVIYFIGKIRKVDFKMDYQKIKPLFILGLFNVALNFGLSFMGMNLISGTSTAMMNALSPVVIGIFCHDHKLLFPMSLCVIGVICSFHFDFSLLNAGHLLLLASIACYAGSFLYGKNIIVNPLVKTFYALLFGGVMLFVWQGKIVFLQLNMIQWILFILISVVGFAIIQWIYFMSSETLGMKKTSFYMNLNPVFTYIGSLIFLAEPFDWFQFLGMILVVVGLIAIER